MSKTIIEVKLVPEDDADHGASRRLAITLKRLLRDHGWCCVSIRESAAGGDVNDEQREQREQH